MSPSGSLLFLTSLNEPNFEVCTIVSEAHSYSEGNVLVAQYNLQLLPPYLVWLGPLLVILPTDNEHTVIYLVISDSLMILRTSSSTMSLT